MDHATHPLGRRVLLTAVCLVVAPLIGVWAGGSMPNPPGNGPGVGQVVVGVAIPVVFAFLASRFARVGRVEATLWTVASLAATGGLVLSLIWFVSTYLPT
jgi:hypothetical protein